jgi:hypothetical protein
LSEGEDFKLDLEEVNTDKIGKFPVLYLRAKG